MEESKYYIPELEEFHVGFEFDYFNKMNYNDSDWEKTELLHPVVSGYLWKIEDFPDLIEKEQVRVKFLDREDIESLGWKFSLMKGNTNRAFKDLQSNTEKCIGLVLEIRNDKIMIADCRLEFHQILFFGTIKNKSELRKLMQTLQIK